MSAPEQLEIKNKYTGEVIRTIPADNKETLNAKIKEIHRNRDVLKKDNLFSVQYFRSLLTSISVQML